VAGASGIMLFAPETPGAFALAPVPPASEPALPAAVTVAPALPVPAPGVAERVDGCRDAAAKCEVELRVEPPTAVPDDRTPADVKVATAPAHGDAAKPAPEAATPPAGTVAKSPAETDLHADFLVSRPIASVAPQLAAAFTAATVPAMFLASRQIAATPHPLVSPALPALAARPKPVVTTAVALPVPTEPPAAQPAKPRKTQKRQASRPYSNDYYYRRQQQNFFPFFFR